MKNKGFTIFEIMVVLSIIGILLAIGLPFWFNQQSNISIGFNGVSETRCIEGYKFVVGSQGNARQIYDSMGHGVPCNR